MKRIDAVAAGGLVSTAVLASLIKMLIIKGHLNSKEVIEIYDGALLMLEQQHSSADPENGDVYAAARLVIEGMLKQ